MQMCIHNLVNRMGDIYNMKFKYSCKSKIDICIVNFVKTLSHPHQFYSDSLFVVVQVFRLMIGFWYR